MVDSRPIFSQAGLDIYFQSRRAGLDARLASRLVAFIDATQQTLDCAIYDLRHHEILDALVRVAHAGKQLRIVFDGGKERAGGLMADPKPAGTEQALQDAGLLAYATPVHAGGGHLMHDKFLVRDGQHIWTGSANFTVGGLELQDNQCLTVASPEMAASYIAIFEALQRGDHHNHPPSQSDTLISYAGITLTPMFEPDARENIEQVIVDALSGAHRVRMLAFLVSDPGILDALAKFAPSTADISGVYDPHGMQDVLRYSKQDPSRFWFMRDPRFAAAPSHAFNPKGEQNFMHNKVFIIDDQLVLTGSYNFSQNAEANDENLVVIDSPVVAAAYTAYFDALYKKYAGSSR